MCGISGFNWQDGELVDQMVECLKHRGPDAQGTFTEDGVSFGHNRLSIIDLSPEANQPMISGDGKLVIVYNGEIYNYRELREKMRTFHLFKTESDTEVILAGYQRWGKEIVNELNGIFAFAIWDRSSRKLFCARDHMGVKPFYYFWDGKRLIFASEIKAILLHNIPKILNIGAFNRYLRILYSPEPQTMIKGIFKLPPSSVLTLENGNISVELFGQNKPVEKILGYDQAISRTREIVMKSVEKQLVSDVPIGVYLSGGIDSSVILSAMSKLRGEVKTFSIGFELSKEEESEKFNHDFRLAEKTAKFFGAEHQALTISVKEALDLFETVAIHNDDPISNPTSIAMWHLAHLAKSSVSVVLAGDGGDELFGGYDRYRMALLASYYKKLPKIFRHILSKNTKLSKLNYNEEIDLFARFMFEKDEKLSKIITKDFFENDIYVKKYFNDRYISTYTGDVTNKLMSADQDSWLVDQAFGLSDRMSMSSALEERVPFVDKDLVSFARSMPRSYKVDLLRTKKVLKDAFRNDLPEFLFDEPKRGWFSPGAKWLRDPNFSKFAKEILSAKYCQATEPLFDWKEISEMLEDHISKKRYNLTLIWALMNFQVWMRHYKINL